MAIITIVLFIAGSFAAGYFTRPLISGVVDKETNLAKSKIVAIETIIKNEIDKEEDKIKKIVSILKA